MSERIPNFDHKELTYQIIAAAFEVHNVLGDGFLENVYEKSLVKELDSKGVKTETKASIMVRYKGAEVGLYYDDVIVNDEIILELNVVENLNKAHEAQLLNCLKATNKKIGMLINFGKDKVEYKRFVL
jgi:GxxExxY protein